MSLASVKINVADILCEFFEVILHNVLYIRKLYPETIFVPKKKYGVVVYQSVHPDLNEYINQCLRAVAFHAKNNKLKRLFVCFHDDVIFEKYVFEVLELTNFVESDPFLVDLEQSLRDFMLKLHSSQNYLEDLSDNATFSVRIETTAYSSLEFNQNPAFENFPWIELSEENGNYVSSPDIVPIHSVKTSFLTVQVYVEKETE
ncbi:mitotic spindle assembly checkpoint protein MAD2B [Anoplophora glabripennis]|uniref:mitotic spindle assembly checkpoint protein MAD2B n=1 Tax=Anoplophora glabripennis TaxID=217634 RepID=UPI0008755AB2|nr:mitotic spindle assembly checkpoint protein MAD2B [Anoplophora glabripennis]